MHILDHETDARLWHYWTQVYIYSLCQPHGPGLGWLAPCNECSKPCITWLGREFRVPQQVEDSTQSSWTARSWPPTSAYAYRAFQRDAFWNFVVLYYTTLCHVPTCNYEWSPTKSSGGVIRLVSLHLQHSSPYFCDAIMAVHTMRISNTLRGSYILPVYKASNDFALCLDPGEKPVLVNNQLLLTYQNLLVCLNLACILRARSL